METRISTNNDKQVLKELFENSFHYSNSFLDWYFDKVFVPSNTLITADEQGAVSGISLIPQKLMLSGYEANAAYISGLAILPEMRSEANIKKQISDAIVMTVQRGFLLSVVIPSNYRFYERYGWRTAYSYKQYDIKPSDLPAYQIRCRFTRAKISDETIKELNDIYTVFTADKNAYALRDQTGWTLILEDLFCNFNGQCIILKDSENVPVGYILSIIRDRKMWIYEFAYKNRAAYESIIGFIRSHELNIDNIAIKAACDDLSYLDFCDNREAVRFCPFAMARISDAAAALKIASANLSEGFKIQIVDRLVEANNKTFFISMGEASETAEDADVITDIGALTQMFMGYISVDEACRMNLVSGNSELLKKIFDKKNNYINMLLI